MSSGTCPHCSRPLTPGVEGCPACGTTLEVVDEAPRRREDDYVPLPMPGDEPGRKGPRFLGQPLWLFGFLCIVGSAAAGAVAREIGPVVMNREEALGQAAAQLLFFLTGLTLIIVHWVKWLRRR